MDPARLEAIELFRDLDEEQRSRLAGIAGELEVPAGETIAQEGDFGAALFAIEEGTADVLRNGEHIATLGAGDVFGEVAVLRSGRRIATVVASSPMRLITVLNRDVWRLEQDAPAMAEALRDTVRRRVAETLGST